MNSPSTTSHWPLSIVSAAISLINMLLPILLVRILSPEAIGDYKIFFLYLSLAPAFSLISGLVSNIPFWSSQRSGYSENLRASFQLVLISALTFSTVTLVGSSYLEATFEWSNLESKLFALAVFGAVAHQFIEDCLISKGKIWFSTIFSGSFDLTKCFLMLLAAWWTKDTIAIFACYAVIMALKVFFAVLIGFREGLFSLHITQKDLQTVARKAFPISVASLFSIFLDRADQLVLSNLLTSGEFAVYSLGCLVVPPLFSLENSIMRISIPQIAKAYSDKQFYRAAQIHSHAIEQLSLFILPATAGLIVFAEPIVILLFTDSYIAAAGYMRVFAFSYLILIFPFDACARAVGSTKWIFNYTIIFSLLTLLMASLGAWITGAYGVLIGALASKTLMRAWGIRYSKNILASSYSEILPLLSLSKEIGIVLSLSLFCLSTKEFYTSQLSWLLVSGSLFALIYIPIALFLRNKAMLKLSSDPRTLLLVQNLQIGGLEKMVVSLATELQRKQANVQILAYDTNLSLVGSSLSDQATINQVKLTELSKSSGFSFSSIISIVRIVFKERINIVHTHNIGPLIYASIARILMLGYFKIVHTNHSFTELEKYPRYRIYEKYFTKFCSCIVPVSPEILNLYKELAISNKNLEVIPNGIAISSKAAPNVDGKLLARQLLIDRTKLAALGKFLDCRWIVALARLHPLKGQDRAIKIWNALDKEAKQESCLIIIGPDTDPDFAALCRDLTLDNPDVERIIFAGPTLDPQTWYEVADLFLSVSRLEGLPLAPLEAVASSLSLVLSDIEGHKFLAEHSCLIDADETEESAKSLSKTLRDLEVSANQERLRKSSSWVSSHFSLEGMATQYLKLYCKVLKYF